MVSWNRHGNVDLDVAGACLLLGGRRCSLVGEWGGE